MSGQRRRLAKVIAAFAIAVLLSACSSASYGDDTTGGGGRFNGGDGDDLDCSDVGRPVAVQGADPNSLDADNDGIGCEE